MRFRFILVLLLVLAASGAAQEAWLVPFAAAYMPDVAGFNRKFAANSVPEAEPRHYGWGIEVRSVVSGMLVGPMYFRTWDDADDADFHLRTEASGIFALAGLKLQPFPFLSVVPTVGLGGLSQSYSIRAKTGDIKFEELLLDPGQTATLLSGMKASGLGALELGLAASTEGGRYGVALRAGYLYSPLSVTWHLPNGARILDTPRARFGGPFFSLGVLVMPAAQTASARL